MARVNVITKTRPQSSYDARSNADQKSSKNGIEADRSRGPAADLTRKHRHNDSLTWPAVRCPAGADEVRQKMHYSNTVKYCPNNKQLRQQRFHDAKLQNITDSVWLQGGAKMTQHANLAISNDATANNSRIFLNLLKQLYKFYQPSIFLWWVDWFCNSRTKKVSSKNPS